MIHKNAFQNKLGHFQIHYTLKFKLKKIQMINVQINSEK